MTFICIKKKLCLILFAVFISQLAFAASLPPVEGKSCMVVSAQHYATKVGLDILKKGGNAIDAAVGMGYALAVVHPCCGNIGGGGFMLIHLANRKNTFLNFREKAPKSIKISMFQDKNGNVVTQKLSSGHIGGTLKSPFLAVGVPGTVLGLNTALQKYGRMPLSTVIQPAIKLAREGYQLQAGDIDFLKTGTESFKAQSNVSAIFLRDGKPLQAFDKLVQENLAKTLEEISLHGSSTFYHGKIAKELVKASQEQGGVLKMQDLARYTVEELKPLICQYRGYTIVTSAPPSAGGVTICEILNITEHYPLAQMGFHSAQSTHTTVEAMRYAYADRNSKLGDPNFVKNPLDRLLSKKYATEINKKISTSRATRAEKIRFNAQVQEGHNTTAYVVVDKFGNAVAVTYTLNDYFGAKVIAGKTGFFLNNELADFTIKNGIANNYGLVQGDANILQPEKRPLSSMAPTMIFKDNQLRFVMSTPGGSTIPTQLVGFIQNVIDYEMNIQEAENAPRFHMQSSPNVIFVEPFALSRDTQTLLEKMGHKIKIGSPYNTLYWGSITSIAIDAKNHKIYGAIDARRPAGLAAGL